MAIVNRVTPAAQRLMVNKLYNFANGLPEKLVDFYITIEGLGNRQFLQKNVPKLHYALGLFNVMTIIQEIIGVWMLLNRGQFTMDELILHLMFAYISFLGMSGVYTLCYTQSSLTECMRNAAPRLNCYSGRDLPSFKHFITSFAITIYSLLLGMVVVSPLVRFKLTQKTPSFVVFPNWYPVDVLSCHHWFWAAFVLESVVFGHTIHAIATTTGMFYYTLMAVQVRFDALGRSFEATSSSHRVESTENLKLDGLRKGMEDWGVLRRQMQRITSTFSVYNNVIHFSALATTVVMAIAATKKLQNSHEGTLDAITGSLVYLMFVSASIVHLSIVSFSVSSLQESHGELLMHLWKCGWLTEGLKFKRLLLYGKAVMNQPLTIKVFYFHPISLITFTEDLARMWSFYMFLYHITTPKQG